MWIGGGSSVGGIFRMGWFGNVCRSIGRKFGEIVERTGDILNSDTLRNVGWKIQDACAEKVGQEKSYEKENANINSTERINEILVSFSEGYFKQATRIENNCIQIVEEFYDELLQLLQNSPDLSGNRANMNILIRGKQKIRTTIEGGIKEPLAKRMSLDDSECLRILKMEQGIEKTQVMSDFSHKVIDEALGNLSKKVRVSINEQLEDVENYLKDIAEEQEKAFSSLKEHFQKMSNNDIQEIGAKEGLCVKPLLTIDTVDIIKKVI